MKLRSYLVFLVLALVCISRGDEGAGEATASTDTTTDNRPQVLQTDTEPPPTMAASTPTASLNESTHEATLPTIFSTSPEENTTVTDELEKYFTKNITNKSTNEPGEEGSSSFAPQMTTPGGTTSQPAPDKTQDNTSWGYVILVLIIVIVIVLCVILYFLRRVSRTYSFDLQRPSPAHNLSEPIGTFEPVYLDDLERPALKDQVISDEPSTPSTANGTRLQAEEKSSNGDAPQEQPNGLQGAPTSDTNPSLDSHADNRSSPDLFFNTTKEEQQNENNNNPITCSSLPFVEINLEEPPWCDQLLSSPQAPSSVLPFSPFSSSS